MTAVRQDHPELHAYLEYFRDLGVYDFYRNAELPAGAAFTSAAVKPQASDLPAAAHASAHAQPPGIQPELVQPAPVPPVTVQPATVQPGGISHFPPVPPPPEPLIPKPLPFNQLAPLPDARVKPAARLAALEAIRADIGDCTRCPLAYAGRRNIVFGEGDPNATLMFVGEGPGADEDETGRPFIGKSGQLLTNMITAMGFAREQVYIANIVKCRPPANRAPEYVEATTCSQFLVRQIDVVQPKFIVALGTTAASYLLGSRQSLASLRGQWHDVRGAKAIVTFHPAYLLRDPRQKAEAWKDLQTVMSAMGVTAAKKS